MKIVADEDILLNIIDNHCVKSFIIIGVKVEAKIGIGSVNRI